VESASLVSVVIEANQDMVIAAGLGSGQEWLVDLVSQSCVSSDLLDWQYLALTLLSPRQSL
jgi:hypothetical protein